ncbi:MAG: 23S rRNA (adenine(2503)-C(2))-methyltransferase RlmN [Tenericutes bacterium]|nr:23S rRNA (adenine(2503)-C(2))-methyltransferase RlmN [Mycoplasmatota bacterium]
MNIYGIEFEKLEKYFVDNNISKFRATQVFEWLYKKRVDNLNEMTNLGKETIDKLQSDFSFDKLKLLEVQSDKLVKKFLFELSDGQKIESVLMYHDYGNSICISSQVGCNMGCAFCQSGRLKKVRNLATHEMVLQILEVEKITGIRISHVVIMGIGEPFDNYDNVMSFIRIINSNKGISIGARHITVSTCGIVPKIEQFSKENLQVNLAISLHAANDELRNKLMPINKVYNISKLIDSLKKYLDNNNRRVTFEYILLSGINDSLEDAMELANLLKGMNAYVNLIPYNETDNILFKRTKNEQIMRFYDILKKSKINVTVRREFGSKVDAACGQLRANYSKGKE